MTQPYSEDLRERAMARLNAGETIRSIAAALSIAPSCVSKWKKRLAETGALTPARVGGRKQRTLSGERADWLRQRCRSGPFTTRGPCRGTGRTRRQDRAARRLGVRPGRGPELQKKRFCRPSRRGWTSPGSGCAGKPINDGSKRGGWSFSMRPGSRPTWRPSGGGHRVANASVPRSRMGTGKL